MKVVVQLSDSAARALRGEAPVTGSVEELVSALGTLDARLEPLHPSVRTSALATYFTVEARDEHTANRMTSVLRKMPEVVAAYVKPADEKP